LLTSVYFLYAGAFFVKGYLLVIFLVLTYTIAMNAYLQKLKKTRIKSLLMARNLLYHLESIPIMQTQKILGRGFSTYKPTPQDVSCLKEEVEVLIEKDTQGFMQGYFPTHALQPLKGIKHYKRYFNILLDNFSVAMRKRNNETQVFKKKQSSESAKYPDYYLRNFHFQTDGYLSKESAEIYEHQVEILFKGTADSMRRRMVSMLKDEPTVGTRFLELGSGVGSATEFMAFAFPAAEITCLDLSETYLQKAKDNLKAYPNINFIRGAAENLDFKDNTFDVVFSTYLMHELPANIRQEVIKEAHRVLRKGGHLLLADSTQIGDRASLNWLIKDFPRNFHEPYYMNYIKQPLEGILEDSGFELRNKDVSFLTKTLVAKKV